LEELNVSDSTAASNPEDTAANNQPDPAGAVPNLQSQVDELQKQLKEKDAKYLYLYAEFENFKKRAEKDRDSMRKFGWESIAKDLLQVADHLELALSHVPAGTDKGLIQGLNMVLGQFRGAMEKQGVQMLKSLGQPFDPNFHEAVSQEASDKPAGTVIQEHGQGYTLHGRLLRPARVVVSAGSAANGSAG
jgi:molecular chaperone GrpE